MTQNDLQNMSDLALAQIGMTYEIEKYITTDNASACTRLYKSGLKHYYDYHKVIVKSFYLGRFQPTKSYHIYQEADGGIEIAKGVYAKDIFAPDDNFGVIYDKLLEMLQAIANEVPVTIKLGFCYRHPFYNIKMLPKHEKGKALDFTIDFGEDWMDDAAKVYTILKDNNFIFKLWYSPTVMHLESVPKLLKHDHKKYHFVHDNCLYNDKYQAWVTEPSKSPLFAQNHPYR